jgi:Zn-dependent peptidase ImmA (M78 family)
MTMRAVPGPVTDERAYALRERFHDAYAHDELPVPLDAIARDLLGLHVEEDEIDCSGLLVPAERRVVLRASEPEPRRRFTLAHEVGHWVCQVLEGHTAPVYCRDVDLSAAADRQLEREANVFAAELLMPEPAVRRVWAGSIADSAATFGVSEEAMHWRLYNLRTLSERPTSGPWRKIGETKSSA